MPEVRLQGLAGILLQASRGWARQQRRTAFASDRRGRIVIDKRFQKKLVTFQGSLTPRSGSNRAPGLVTFGNPLGLRARLSHCEECRQGVMMKSTPQIAHAFAARSKEQLQHRIFELAVKPEGMLHPKIGWRNQNERLRILLTSGKIAQLPPSRVDKTPFGLRPNAN